MDKDSLVFLEGLCNAYGPSGFERNVTLLIKDRLEGYAENMITDRMGTMVFSAGGPSDGPTILVPGHVDEVGMLISSISPDGYLTFYPLGGWFDQVLLGQRVNIMTKKGSVRGVIASKPPHIMDPQGNVRKSLPRMPCS